MTSAFPFATIRRLAAVIAIGCALAGCSKCQDWQFFYTSGVSLDACKSDAPPQR